ncbi:MAG: hypothetical protein ACK4JE_04035, partial [Endomicrobiia bacterium]
MKIRYRFEFFFCKILEFVVLSLPQFISKNFCILVVLLAKIFLISRRKLVLSNLFSVFKDKSSK